MHEKSVISVNARFYITPLGLVIPVRDDGSLYNGVIQVAQHRIQKDIDSSGLCCMATKKA
jgi:hypothetical protein